MVVLQVNFGKVTELLSLCFCACEIGITLSIYEITIRINYDNIYRNVLCNALHIAGVHCMLISS